MPRQSLTRRRFVIGTGMAAGAWAVTGGQPAAADSHAPRAGATASRPALAEFAMGSVLLLDSPFLDNMRRTCAYLEAVDIDRLLHTFRTNVGLPSSAQPCGGWEAPDVQLRGHTTGHLLSGLALAHANTGDDTYADKGRRIVDVLSECQAASPAAGYGEGYLSAFPEQVFAALEAGSKPWAPYYTIHKIMAGLLDQYQLCGNETALDVLKAMTAWADRRTAPLGPDQLDNVRRVEWGGMNDVLAALYLATGNPAALRTARRFDQENLFGPLAEGRDELDGRHANTEIAKIVGAARMYEATGERRYHAIASNFWDIVVHDHSYVIGGNANQEFFGPPGEIVSRLSEETCENCNTYNMLKLGRRLFLDDPSRAERMDHYEWALYNQMLGEQDPDSPHGFVTYYTGLWAGSERQPKGGLGAAPGSYSGDYDNFSCDHGTGLETHTKFADSIYFRSTGAGRPELYVNLFIPSELHWREQGVTIRQESGGYPESGRVRLTVTGPPSRFRLRMRIPGWLADGTRPQSPRITVNGRTVCRDVKPGTYATLDREWRSGDTVVMTLPREIVERPAPDNPHVVGLSYGPLVLAGEYGTTASVTIPALDDGPVRRVSGGGTVFTARADGAPVTLRPFHQVHHQHYNVYFARPPRQDRPREVARYPLDEGTGTAVADATGRHPEGLLAGGASWTAGRGAAEAVALDGTSGHVVLARGLPSGLGELTVSAWARLDSVANSARIFDLGYHKSTYLFLAARTGTGCPRAALKIAGMEAEDVVDADVSLPLGRWVHVALTLGGGTGVLYIDGAETGRNETMVCSPLLLGGTTKNYLGRSQNATHPYLHGAVADFRLHNRVLSPRDVAAMARG
ncbi:beta-L-arabinofuranosidase domain-containing protein [Streptomyces sp. NPDC002690]